MATPAIQTLITDAQQVLNLKSLSEIRATLTAVLANANVGTPLNPNLTTQQLWDEFYEIVRQTPTDIESILVNQMMKFVFSPPAPGGAGANGQVIFNDGGALAGDAGLTYDKTTDKLTVGTVGIWDGPGSGANNIGVGGGAINNLSTGANNVAVGLEAGRSVTTGASNVAIGNLALGNSAVGVTSAHNIAIGTTAMYSGSAISGSDNVGIGRDTFRNLSTGAGNVAIGLQALNGTTTGLGNTAIGQSALSNNTVGFYGVAIGQDALRNATVGSLTAVGVSALEANTNGTGNTAVGRSALSSVVSNSGNTALGYYAAKNVTGSDNVAIGYNALNLGTTATGNVAIGTGSLGNAIVSGNYNICVGQGSGYVVTSGTSNAFIGTDAGSVTTTGSSNICIGRSAVTAATDSNVIAIGSSTYFVGTNGAANTYYATATAGAVALPAAAVGFWRVSINGTFRKIAVYAD